VRGRRGKEGKKEVAFGINCGPRGKGGKLKNRKRKKGGGGGGFVSCEKRKGKRVRTAVLCRASGKMEKEPRGGKREGKKTTCPLFLSGGGGKKNGGRGKEKCLFGIEKGARGRKEGGGERKEKEKRGGRKKH